MNIDTINKICIVGWARSGVSLCNLLLSLKKKVMVTEAKQSNNFPCGLIDRLRNSGVDFEFGGHSEKFMKQADSIVLSPGADSYAEPLKTILKNLNIPYAGEVEFSSWLTKARFIAITGTNGKTTTAFLTYRVLKEKRKNVFLAGNIGIPLSSVVLQTKKNDVIVLEISSFQLETIIKFRPYIAAVLNIEPDHMDRYKKFNDYFEAKMNIFRNQNETDWAVIKKDSNLSATIKKRLRSSVATFDKEFKNENYSCIYRIVSIIGLTKTDCLRVFSGFKGLPHRLQTVREIKGVKFINDSKATNPSSTVWALSDNQSPVILIAGGKDKGLDYLQITPYLKKVKKINLIGQASLAIKKALEGKVAIELFASLENAVIASFKSAQKGDIVLLSPMCSSYDMFKNYIDRGNKFIKIVNSL